MQYKNKQITHLLQLMEFLINFIINIKKFSKNKLTAFVGFSHTNKIGVELFIENVFIPIINVIYFIYYDWFSVICFPYDINYFHLLRLVYCDLFY